MSPFFVDHGYHVEHIQQVEPENVSSEPAKRARDFVKRLQDAQELAQTAMASSQHAMEKHTNRNRKEAETLKKVDKVWLNLKNVQTPQLSKKLSWINGKYQVTKITDSHCVELNTPSEIWPRFHVDLLKRAVTHYHHK